jgi:hypothetical protein
MAKSSMAVNPKKTQSILLYGDRRCKPTLPDLYVMGDKVSIDTEGSLKYLGVYIDPHLNLSKNVSEICKAAFYQLRIIRRARCSLDITTTKWVCNSVVLSRLEYCIVLLNGVNSCHREKLQKVINAAARTVCNARRFTPTTPLLNKLEWLNIDQRCLFHTACFIHKILYTGVPSYLKEELQPYNPQRALRSSSMNLLTPAIGKRTVGKLIFKVLAANVWNKLPDEVRSEEKFTAFCGNLRRILVSAV